jgi:hypothetical protein
MKLMYQKYTLAGKIPNQDMYLLCANSSEERQDWLKAMRKVIYSDIGGG